MFTISGGNQSSLPPRESNLILESMKKHYLKSGFWMSKKNHDKRKENEDKKRWFMDNGSIFLKELIADCNGKSIPLRSFSSHQILRATNNFNSSCFISEDAFYKWYRGKIEDRSYMIKKFVEDRATNVGAGEVYNDFVLSARMSNHSNFLKLLGFSLEFLLPVLVFEDAEHGVLNSRGGVTVDGAQSMLPLNLRLKIAKEIANAVTYLHMAFPKIIIHRDIKPTLVFLDKNWTAKLSDLSSAILLEEGKSQIEAGLVGTIGYLDPLYCATNFVSGYTDVYSFGVFLMVVMTGRLVHFTGSDGCIVDILDFLKGLYENGKLDEVMDQTLMQDTTSGKKLQVEGCMVLALRCCEEKHEDRPKMIQVAKELKRLDTGQYRSLLGFE